MATQFEDIDNNWKDIKDTLTLVDESTYSVQNLGSSQIYLNESVAQPAADARGHIIAPLKWANAKIEVGVNLWVRSAVKKESEISVTEGVS